MTQVMFGVPIPANVPRIPVRGRPCGRNWRRHRTDRVWRSDAIFIACLNVFDTKKHCGNNDDVWGLDWMTMLPWQVERKALCRRMVRDRIYKAVSLALPTVSDFSEEALQ